jgi:AcrR family transcriptional regulator
VPCETENCLEGLRERNKRRTRAEIAATALRLFIERGFDKVSVIEVARAAGVAEKTIYNYFPSKASLVFDEDPAVLAAMVDAVRHRAVGESAIGAVRKALASVAGQIGDSPSAEARAGFQRMVAASETLLAHQRLIVSRYERSLAAVLADETGVDHDSPEPVAAAIALVGALRAGYDSANVSGGVGLAIDRALDLLEAGLGSYATTPLKR